jgi:hypothetical protein
MAFPDFWKDYNKPYEKRILLQVIVALILSVIIGLNDPIKLIFSLLGIFFLLDLFLTRLDKIIKLLELRE